MNDIDALRRDVDDIIANIEKNIKRRRRALEREDKVAVVENKIISEALSSIPGISKRLAQMRQGKKKAEQEMAMDVSSHATHTIGEIRRKL